MILLPRRGILQELLVRQLKRLRVPVAGADRLALIDEIAVMDLVALGDALLLPEDDLTLAAVLKSPLFGLGEDDLFELAYDRGEASLHERLRALAGAREVFAEAHERFRRAAGAGRFPAAVRVLHAPARRGWRARTVRRAPGRRSARADRGFSGAGAGL